MCSTRLQEKAKQSHGSQPTEANSDSQSDQALWPARLCSLLLYDARRGPLESP